jgi:hypothetical protein
MMRLDALFRAHWQAAVSGDVKATDICLRILERYARSLGLDKVHTVDVSGIIEEWAIREGLEPAAVFEVTEPLVARLNAATSSRA